MQDPNFMISILALITGLCLGSFINVIIYRLPQQLKTNWEKDSRDFLGLEQNSLSTEEESAQAPEKTSFNIAKPASHCPKCQTPLKAWHNIPLISYFLLKGKCGHCQTPIPIQYPLVELAAGVISMLVISFFGLTANGFCILAFSLILLTLTGIDIKTKLLPDILTYPLLWLGLLANTQSMYTDINSAVIGAVIGYMSLWSVYWVFKLFTGKEGMGHGDFKLLAALGAWLGWQMLPLIILLSSFVGAVVGIGMTLMLGRDKQIPIAFGPYLAIAGIIAFFWGKTIVTSYLGYLH